MTRNSLACMGREVSPTSSRNTVPPLAYSNRPGEYRGAGEGAADMAEQLALQRVSTMAEQLQTAKRCWLTGLI